MTSNAAADGDGTTIPSLSGKAGQRRDRILGPWLYHRLGPAPDARLEVGESQPRVVVGGRTHQDRGGHLEGARHPGALSGGGRDEAAGSLCCLEGLSAPPPALRSTQRQVYGRWAALVCRPQVQSSPS